MHLRSGCWVSTKVKTLVSHQEGLRKIEDFSPQPERKRGLQGRNLFHQFCNWFLALCAKNLRSPTLASFNFGQMAKIESPLGSLQILQIWGPGLSRGLSARAKNLKNFWKAGAALGVLKNPRPKGRQKLVTRRSFTEKWKFGPQNTLFSV